MTQKYPLSVRITQRSDTDALHAESVEADDVLVIAMTHTEDNGVFYQFLAASGTTGEKMTTVDVYHAWLILAKQLAANLEPGLDRDVCTKIAEIALVLGSPMPVDHSAVASTPEEAS